MSYCYISSTIIFHSMINVSLPKKMHYNISRSILLQLLSTYDCAVLQEIVHYNIVFIYSMGVYYQTMKTVTAMSLNIHIHLLFSIYTCFAYNTAVSIVQFHFVESLHQFQTIRIIRKISRLYLVIHVYLISCCIHCNVLVNSQNVCFISISSKLLQYCVIQLIYQLYIKIVKYINYFSNMGYSPICLQGAFPL